MQGGEGGGVDDSESESKPHISAIGSAASIEGLEPDDELFSKGRFPSYSVKHV
jgi:hypothetical protein